MNFLAFEYHKNEEETRITILKIGKFTVFEMIIPKPYESKKELSQ